MEKYLDIDQQIVHLFIDKSVMFERTEIDSAKKILRDNNYRNFVFCSKVKFVEFIDEYLMMYKTAKFEDWRAYFEMDCRVSEHLIKNIAVLERTLNSRISAHISEWMNANELNDYEKNEIISKITRIQNRNGIKFSKYKGDNSWVYISEMSFGEMKQILLWIYDNRRKSYFEIISGYSFLSRQVKMRIDEVNILRNNLFHHKPITIYLTKGNSYNNKIMMNRLNTIKWISEMKIHHSMRACVDEICTSSKNFIKIKNSLH